MEMQEGVGVGGFAHLCFQHLARLVGAHAVAAARVSPLFPPPSSDCWSSSSVGLISSRCLFVRVGIRG